jgi:hypothetical protein
MIRALAVGGLLLSASTSSFAFDVANFTDFSSLVSVSSTWKNQSGSTMMISIDTFGNVGGQYINRAAGTGCQNTPYPLVGRVTDDFIAFSVAWNNATENCHSATGWAGYAQLSGSNVEIVTNWNLAYQSASGPMIEQGSDTFTYVPQASTETFLMK